jgi:hypothetical protein
MIATVTAVLNTLLAKPIARVVEALGLPAAYAEVAQHCVVVFAGTFAAQVVVAYTAGLHWGSLWALVASAGATAVSASVHYLLGLIPAPASTAAKK